MLEMVFAAVMTLTPPPPLDTSQSGVANWTTAYIAVGNAQPLAFNSYMTTFLELEGLERRKDDHIRGWLRVEFFSPQHVYNQEVRSAAILTEFDCQSSRTQELATDYYPFNNLQGVRKDVDEQTPQWSYPRPGSIDALNLKDVCDVKDQVDARNTASQTNSMDAHWSVTPK